MSSVLRISVVFLMVSGQLMSVTLERCEGDRRYDVDKGRCVMCKCRRAGYGWDLNYSRRENKTHGYLDCYPCEKCPAGYYRLSGDYPTCNMCTLNCAERNRFESQPCGGAREGHCGSCKPGFTPDTLEANDKCVPTKQPVLLKPADQDGGDISLEVDENSDPLDPDQGTSDGPYPALLTFVALFGVPMTGIILWFIAYKVYKRRREPGEWKGDNTKGLASTSSTTPFLDPEQVRDIDTDGVPNVICRPELLPRIEPTSEIRALMPTDRPGPPNYFLSDRNPEEVRLYQAIFELISTKACGKENLAQLFIELNLKDVDYIPPRELWEADPETQSHSQYVYTVLKTWFKKFYNSANVGKLYTALWNAGFSPIAEEVMVLCDNHEAAQQNRIVSIHKDTPTYHCNDQENTLVKESFSVEDDVTIDTNEKTGCNTCFYAEDQESILTATPTCQSSKNNYQENTPIKESFSIEDDVTVAMVEETRCDACTSVHVQDHSDDKDLLRNAAGDAEDNNSELQQFETEGSSSTLDSHHESL